MRLEKTSALWTMRFCVLFLFVTCGCGSAEQAPPRGLVVSSVQVSPGYYTEDGGRYDLFLQTVPEGKVTRLTDHKANPKLKLGGAIRDPLFSHDGKRVLFLADYAVPGQDKNECTGFAPNTNSCLNVWDVRLDTKQVSPLTKGDLGWYIAGWSPDDRYACAVYSTGVASPDQNTPIPDDIYVWDMTTRKGHKVIRVAQEATGVSWSRDGKRIMYGHVWPFNDTNVYSVPAVGGKPRTAFRWKFDGYGFSPDGHRVVATISNRIYVANANGSKPKLIMKLIRDEHDVWVPRMQWSRDSKKLAIAVREPSGNAHSATKLHVCDISTGIDKTVATLEEYVDRVIWSKDGRWIIVEITHAGTTDDPDPKTGRYYFRREGLLAFAVSDGHAVTLKKPNEETNGLDWIETGK